MIQRLRDLQCDIAEWLHLGLCMHCCRWHRELRLRTYYELKKGNGPRGPLCEPCGSSLVVREIFGSLTPEEARFVFGQDQAPEATTEGSPTDGR